LRIRHNRGQDGIEAAYMPFDGGLWRFPEHFIPVCRMVFSKKLSLAGEDFIEVKYKPNYYAKGV